MPVPRINSIEEFNQKLWNNCLKYRESHKVESRQQPVYVQYQQELKHLRAIPLYRYDTSKTTILKVDDYSTVKFEKNYYSVPTKYIRRDVTVKGYGVGITGYRLEHYLDLLERKPRSVRNARPVKETLSKELLDGGSLLPGGNREMVKLLSRCVDYGEEKILSIKRMISNHVIPTVDMVRTYLHEPVEESVVYLNNEDLAKYDRKFGVSGQ